LALIIGSGLVVFITLTFYFEASQIEAFKDEQERKEIKPLNDVDASDDKKEKLEFVFWKGLCDVITYYIYQ